MRQCSHQVAKVLEFSASASVLLMNSQDFPLSSMCPQPFADTACELHLCIRNMWTGTVLVGQWLRLCASTAGGAGLIPAWGTKIPHIQISFPGDSDSQEPACSAGDPGSIPGWGRSPGEGNGHPLQYSCLENPMDREPGGLQSTGL